MGDCHMNTRNKVAIIFLIAIALYGIAIAAIMLIQRNQERLLLSSQLQDFRLSTRAALQSKEDVLNNIAVDYTYWDDMVKYLSSKDSKLMLYGLIILTRN
ncbi:MAG: hypothetical protein NTU44_04765 [Bacteroidetes bacterium]|nr:hypothetical protein [Bacteroidota bacterium]